MPHASTNQLAVTPNGTALIAATHGRGMWSFGATPSAVSLSGGPAATGTLSNQGFTTVVTGELLAEELVRTLVGSVGRVASVPITTALASYVVTRRR